MGQKLLNTQDDVGRCARKLPIIKWANMSSFQKNSLNPNAASHNNASWFTDTDGFLEHSPSRESLYYKGLALQKIISVFRGFSLYTQSLRLLGGSGDAVSPLKSSSLNQDSRTSALFYWSCKSLRPTLNRIKIKN